MRVVGVTHINVTVQSFTHSCFSHHHLAPSYSYVFKSFQMGPTLTSRRPGRESGAEESYDCPAEQSFLRELRQLEP